MTKPRYIAWKGEVYCLHLDARLVIDANNWSDMSTFDEFRHRLRQVSLLGTHAERKEAIAALAQLDALAHTPMPRLAGLSALSNSRRRRKVELVREDEHEP